MTSPPRTFSTAHVRRQREAHANADGYGRHRHPYLHDAMRDLASRLRKVRPGEPLSWLDYGCGKGGFIDEIRPMGLFDQIIGYDPAVDAFRTRPEASHHLVTCLHVLDMVEPGFIDAVLSDIARLTGDLAIFDVITRPKPASGLRPHAPFYWASLVRQHLDVTETRVEFAGIEGFERVIVVAQPKQGATTRL